MRYGFPSMDGAVTFEVQETNSLLRAGDSEIPITNRRDRLRIGDSRRESAREEASREELSAQSPATRVRFVAIHCISFSQDNVLSLSNHDRLLRSAGVLFVVGRS